MSIYSNKKFYNDLLTILPSIRNSNKLQTIKKHHLNLWNWIISEVNRLYPQHNQPLKTYIYLLINYPVQLICDCGNPKHYVNGRYMCNTYCPFVFKARENTNIEKYGGWPSSNPNIKEKTRNTNLKRYGYDNPSKNPLIKQQKIDTCRGNFRVDYPQQSIIIRNTTIQNSRINYGADYPNQSPIIKEKRRNKCLEIWGVPHISQSPIIKERIKQSELENWKDGHHSRNKEIQKRQKETYQTNYLKKHNRTNPSQLHISDENLEILNDPIKFAEMLSVNSCSSMAEKLGVEANIISTRHKKFDLDIISTNTSSYERELEIWLVDQNIIFEHPNRTQIKPYELDFYLPDYNIGIEFQGDYWHMNPLIYEANDLNTKMNLYAYQIWERDNRKLQRCKEISLHLLQIWESDWNTNKDKIKNEIFELISSHK